VTINWEDSHAHCVVCGHDNNRSWKLKFLTDQNGKTSAEFQGDNRFQGYKGILHGGIIATLLDATMTHCLFHHNIIALTADMRVRFVHPISYNAFLTLEATIIQSNKSIHVLKAEVLHQQKVMAWGKAKFIQTNYSKL